MDVKKFSQFENIGKAGLTTSVDPLKPGGLTPKGGQVGSGPSFAETLNQTLGQVQGLQNPQSAKPAGVTAAADPVKFSNHAIERMMSRGIQFNKEDMNRLNDAVQRAADKGSRDSLVLMNDSALIVSVKNKTVVTVMDKNALKENVFTNIDSTIVM